MVKEVYYSMIRNLQFSGGTQDLQHKNYLIMDP